MDAIEKVSFGYAKHIKLGVGIRKGAEVQFHPITRHAIDKRSLGIALLVEEHNLDWSGDDPHSSSNAEAVALAIMVFEELNRLAGTGQTLTDSEVSDRLLTAYERANSWAKTSTITASLLTVILIDHVVYVASVGACRSYLIRDGNLSQISVDDYARMDIDGEIQVASNSLSNVIGMGTVDSLTEIHFNRYQTHSEDLLLLCSGAFHQTVSEDEMLRAASLSKNPSILCASLAGMATQRLDPLHALALCVLSVKSAENRALSP